MAAAKKKSAGKARRTTHRSTAGKKLYAVRDSKGRFKDIQTYERAHRADLKRKSKDETEQGAAAAKSKPVTKAPTKTAAKATSKTAAKTATKTASKPKKAAK